MTVNFLRSYHPSRDVQEPAYWFPYQKNRVFVQVTHEGVGHTTIIEGGEEIRQLVHPESLINIGTLDGKACIACEVREGTDLPATWHIYTLWEVLALFDTQIGWLIGYAGQLLLWQRNSRYCPVCAHETIAIEGTWGRHCPNCEHTSYPPVTPAVLVLVHDGYRMLLTHKPGWGKRFSCIAGFVEPGESLEECVRREVREEVNVSVDEIRYVSSQPWPFPHQLMVGFTARYTGGDMQIDRLELDDAAWFDPANVPELPPGQSLASMMITNWIETHQKS